MAIFSQTINKSDHQKLGEKLALELIQKVMFMAQLTLNVNVTLFPQTDGVLCCFEQAMVQLVYFEKQKQRSVPWNCELQIGSQLEIKCSVYVYVS